ncbi:GNAT family N-acetyltransferase [Rossellomorea marisflavi]|uniref:Uncharacterized protein n=1 Tax=Rossellomorea marisflavi TaxID=189381 RepID=A0A0J5Y1J8_9BACI|nr:GNAT family N-acetyltransferase [Rossellomorea marisflavi]KMK95224.1 hypothetical protein VL03_10735 [Rossellomorea marisflavi]KML08311.1 hypothetical protein VL06_02325 [Rossellomorea marisflavi]KML31248.1 hypothetical protein VL12_18040 [Rossellomorea marisflavi]KZE51122.1 hypothetical protein AV649_17315 [Rossellomorea marisflavi]QHA35061.1 GNAT family N-acetyltransferase [Rossellomorea marisflavi]
MNIRQLNSQDYYEISPVINEWWGGRNMADMLPKVFFDHFQDTSFVMERGGRIAGFLVGFLSQSKKGEAYIHFVGVHPEYRQLGIGKALYEQFFAEASSRGCQKVRCLTSPVNTGSIAYHTRMGFKIEKGDKLTDSGIHVHSDYDGKGQDRVLFVKAF